MRTRWRAAAFVWLTLTALFLPKLPLTAGAQAPARLKVGLGSDDVAAPQSPATPSSLQTDPAWSPDGSRFVTVSTHGARVDLWVTDAVTGVQTPWTDDEAEESVPNWSPDGKCIVYVTTRITPGIDVKCAGEQPRRVISDADGPRWSPDGKRILCSVQRAGRHMLLAVPVDGEAEPATVLPWLSSELPHGWIVDWRPDGKHLAVIGFPKSGRLGLWIVPLDSKGSLGAPLVDFVSAFKGGFNRLTSPILSAAADILYVGTAAKGQAHVWRIHLNPAGHEQAGEAESLAQAPADFAVFAVAPDGNHLAVAWASSTTRVWLYPFNAATGAIDVEKGQPIGQANAVSASPDLTPAGDRLVYTMRLRDTDRQELHVREADGADRVIAADDNERYGPRWSPDGTILAYRWRSSGARQFIVRLMNVQKGTEQDLTSAFPTSVYTPFWWSGDGQSVLASLEYDAPEGKKAYAIAQMPIHSGDRKAKVIAANNSFQLWQSSVSRDGKWMTLVAQPLDNKFSSLMVMPAAGGQWNALTDQLGWDDKPRWSTDGRTIYFLSRRSGEFELWSLPFNPQAGTAAGPPHQITHISGPQRHVLRDVGLLELAIGSSRLAMPIEELETQFAMIPIPPAAPRKK